MMTILGILALIVGIRVILIATQPDVHPGKLKKVAGTRNRTAAQVLGVIAVAIGALILLASFCLG